MIKVKTFVIEYLGDNPPKLEDIEGAIIDNNIDDGGLVEVTETKSLHKICEVCNGIGNCDEGAGFSLDCAVCNGSGWRKI